MWLHLFCVSERLHCWMVPPHQGTEGRQQEGSDLIQPRRLPHPILASHQHRALHRELLFCHRRWENPELALRLLSAMRSPRQQVHADPQTPKWDISQGTSTRVILWIAPQSKNPLTPPPPSWPLLWSVMSSMCRLYLTWSNQRYNISLEITANLAAQLGQQQSVRM